MAYHRRSRRTGRFVRRVRVAHRKWTRRGRKSGSFKRGRKSGSFKRSGGSARFARSSSGGGLGGFKTSTLIIGGLAVVGGLYWLSQKRAAASAAAQAASIAAAQTSGGAPFPTATSAMAPAPQPVGQNFLAPLFDLFKPQGASVLPG